MFESIGTAIALIILYFVKEWRDKKVKKKKLANVVDDNVQLYPIIRKLQIEYNASRVCIFQFHNGEHYYSGKHIQRMTMSHEVTDRLTRNVIGEFTDIIIDEVVHNIILSYLDGGDCYKIHDIPEKENGNILQTLDIYKIKSLYSFPLRSREGDIIGQLNFNFNKTNALTDRDEALIRSKKSEIENILNN